MTTIKCSFSERETLPSKRHKIVRKSLKSTMYQKMSDRFLVMNIVYRLLTKTVVPL